MMKNGKKIRRVAMRKLVLFVVGVGSTIGVLLAKIPSSQAAQPSASPQNLEQSILKTQLLPSEQKYASIEGDHLKSYVNDQTAISRRYRDAGHQFWGRIIGTEADAENAE
jgi:hypothetical protein